MSRRLPPSGGSRRLRSPSPSWSRSWCRSTACRRMRDFGPRPSRARRRSPSPARRHRPNRSARNGNRRLPRRRQARCRRKRRRLHPSPCSSFRCRRRPSRCRLRPRATSPSRRGRQAGPCNTLCRSRGSLRRRGDRRPSRPPPCLRPYPGLRRATSWRGKGDQRNDYLSLVFRHLEPYRVAARTGGAARQSGRVVSRVTLARDGRLIDVSIDTSSGRPAIDAAELAAIRQASPFPPVPQGMPGDPVILVLPINY